MTTIQMIEIKKLKLLDNNPRKISKQQFQKLIDSIDEDPEFFDARPCLVNIDEEGCMVVYAGNQRLRAAKALKWKLVPCIVDKNLDDKIIKKRIVKDNVSMGEFDWDILSSGYDPEELLGCGMTEYDMHIPGYNDEEDEQPAQEKSTKMQTCPECGHEFT